MATKTKAVQAAEDERRLALSEQLRSEVEAHNATEEKVESLERMRAELRMAMVKSAARVELLNEQLEPMGGPHPKVVEAMEREQAGE